MHWLYGSVICKICGRDVLVTMARRLRVHRVEPGKSHPYCEGSRELAHLPAFLDEGTILDIINREAERLERES